MKEESNRWWGRIRLDSRCYVGSADDFLDTQRAEISLTWKVGWQCESMLIVHFLLSLPFVTTVSRYSLDIPSMAETCQTPTTTTEMIGQDVISTQISSQARPCEASCKAIKCLQQRAMNAYRLSESNLEVHRDEP